MSAPLYQRALPPRTQVRAFNDAHPVGTAVRVYPGDRAGRHVDTRTRSEASVLSGHTAVVWVDGLAGCFSLSHVDVLPKEAVA
jgi:hypothetical protein